MSSIALAVITALVAIVFIGWLISHPSGFDTAQLVAVAGDAVGGTINIPPHKEGEIINITINPTSSKRIMYTMKSVRQTVSATFTPRATAQSGKFIVKGMIKPSIVNINVGAYNAAQVTPSAATTPTTSQAMIMHAPYVPWYKRTWGA